MADSDAEESDPQARCCREHPHESLFTASGQAEKLGDSDAEASEALAERSCSRVVTETQSRALIRWVPTAAIVILLRPKAVSPAF